MKKILLICFLIVAWDVNFMSGQTIDSVSIELHKTRDLAFGPWDYLSMKSDSFSTGLLMSSLNRNWSVNNWVNNKFDSFTYANGKKATWVSRNWNSTQWIDSLRGLYSYSILTDSSLLQIWNNAWLNYSLSIAYHNTIGLDSLVITQQWRNSIWVNIKKQENIYAVDSTFLSQTFSSWDTSLSQWNFSNRILWFKDSMGNDTGYITQNYVSGLWQNYEGIFSHFAGGHITNQYDYNWSNFDSSFIDLNSISTFTFDSLGRLIYDFNDYFPGGFGTNTYTYDSSGILSNLLSHYETQGGFINEFNTQWIYYSYPNSSIYLFTFNDTITMCGNDSIPSEFFAIGGSPPLHFQWTPINAIDNDTIENPYFIADTSLMISVNVSDGAAHNATDSIYLRVNQPPLIISVQSIASCVGCNNGMFIPNVINGSAPLYYYSITPFVGNIPYADTIMHLAPAIYTICIHDYNQCYVCTIDSIPEENVMVQELKGTRILIYPNPTSDHLYIDLEEQSPCTQVTIFNSYGQEVIRSNYYNVSRFDLEIKGESGLYFVKIVDKEKSRIYRIVKI